MAWAKSRAGGWFVSKNDSYKDLQIPFLKKSIWLPTGKRMLQWDESIPSSTEPAQPAPENRSAGEQVCLKPRTTKVVVFVSCPIPSPGSNPNCKKHHSFQNKEKPKNWSESPQNRERTRLGGCSLLLPHGEHGKRPHGELMCIRTRTHTWVCRWGACSYYTHSAYTVLKCQLHSYKPCR